MDKPIENNYNSNDKEEIMENFQKAINIAYLAEDG